MNNSKAKKVGNHNGFPTFGILSIFDFLFPNFRCITVGFDPSSEPSAVQIVNDKHGGGNAPGDRITGHEHRQSIVEREDEEDPCQTHCTYAAAGH